MMGPLFDLNIEVTRNGDTSIVEAIGRQLKKAIQQGRLQSNYKMPSTRTLADNLGVSRNTIIAVYEDLVITGYLFVIKNKGTYVKQQVLAHLPQAETKKIARLNSYSRATMSKQILPSMSPAKFNFRVGTPDTALFPYKLWRKELAAAARRLEISPNQHQSAFGLNKLRTSLCQHVSYTRAISAHNRNVCVTSGAQHALDMICRVLVQSGKTNIVMEQPGYPMAKHLFKLHGANITYVEVDAEGLCVNQIPVNTDIVYTTPSHQFPLGVAMSANRRAELLDKANLMDFSIIEDDYDSELRLSSTPIDALKSQDQLDNVFYVGTFSKCMFPDIRMGFCIVPEWAVTAIANIKFQTHWFNTALLQEALSEFISQGQLIKHIRKMRKVYAERYQQLASSIHRYGKNQFNLTPAYAGVHVTVKVCSEINAFELANEAIKNDVMVHSIKHFEPTTNHNGLVMGYGNIEVGKIDSGIQRLLSLVD